MSAKPYKITPKKWAEYLRCISEDGLGRAAAAQTIGVTRQCVNAYIEASEARAKERDEAEMRRDDQVVNAQFMAATSGNVPACFGWLYSRRPEDWSDKRNVKVGGDADAPIEIVVRRIEKPLP